MGRKRSDEGEKRVQFKIYLREKLIENIKSVKGYQFKIEELLEKLFKRD